MGTLKELRIGMRVLGVRGFSACPDYTGTVIHITQGGESAGIKIDEHLEYYRGAGGYIHNGRRYFGVSKKDDGSWGADWGHGELQAIKPSRSLPWEP